MERREPEPERVLGSALTGLTYREPVHVVRGEGVWLFDAHGRRLLDCYNNVPCVGHAHPRVVAALAEQTGLLNTHTRYLHEHVVALAERLATSLPGDLSSCYFVCTGTEANDLAVQIARTVSGHDGVVVTERSYHGNSDLVGKLSTDSYPESERPDWLGVVEPPNTYRGPFRAPVHELGALYASLVDDSLTDLAGRGHEVAAMLIDTSWDSNGVLVAPDGYVAQAAAVVRNAGGLVIATDQDSALRTARHTELDTLELLGMAAGLVAVTALTRYALPSGSVGARFVFVLLNAVVAIPLLMVALGPFHVRRLRRGLRKQLQDLQLP